MSARVKAIVALAVTGVALWWTYGLGHRVPLLAYVDLGFHELGHLVFYVFPVSELVTAAAGSVLQLLVPIGLAVYFALRSHDRVAASVCLAWAATSARDVATYIADAPYERLPLIGGEHDWAYLLGPEQLERLDRAAAYAQATRTFGLLLGLAAAALALSVAVERRRVPARRAPREVTIRVLDEIR